MPVQYLNIYLIGFLGSVVAVIVGIGFSYSGMSELGFSVYRGMEMTTYYLDKNRYDLYMNAMVYCITFGAALMLILAVILIPSAQQVQKRMSATPYGTPAIGTPPSGIEAPPMEMEIPSYEEPEMTPELEEIDYSSPVLLKKVLTTASRNSNGEMNEKDPASIENYTMSQQFFFRRGPKITNKAIIFFKAYLSYTLSLIHI